MLLISKATLTEIRARVTLGRVWAAPCIERARQRLTTPRDPFTLTVLRAIGVRLVHLFSSTYAGRLAALVIVLLLLLPAWLWYAKPQQDDRGAVIYPHAGLLNPVLGGVGALFLFYMAIRQARTASEVALTGNRQADIAGRRHLTDTFSKAVEQLSSDKMELRLGGLYTLERLAGEVLDSPRDADSNLYWTVMETLTAFVRERTRRTEAERTAKQDQHIADHAYRLWELAGRPEGRSEQFWADAVRLEKIGEPPETDIKAVFTVIARRGKDHRELEVANQWQIDFSKAVLWYADLRGMHLEGSTFAGAHLDRSSLAGAHLKRVDLNGARLNGASLTEAHLESANLEWAHLNGASLDGARLEGANLFSAQLQSAVLEGVHLEGADLRGARLDSARLRHAYLAGANPYKANFEGVDLHEAHLEGADLRGAVHLERTLGLWTAFGDTRTRLPDDIVRPEHWPPEAPESDEEPPVTISSAVTSSVAEDRRYFKPNLDTAPPP